MEQDFLVELTPAPLPEPAPIGFWQAQCLQAQQGLVTVLQELQSAHQRVAVQERIIEDLETRVAALTQSLAHAHDQDGWLKVVRKHLNAQSPTALDNEMKALTRMFKDKADEIACLHKQIMALQVQLAEFRNPDSSPI